MLIMSKAVLKAMDGRWSECEREYYTSPHPANRMDILIGRCLKHSLSLQCQTVSHPTEVGTDHNLDVDEADEKPPVFCRSGPEQRNPLDVQDSAVYSTFPFNRHGLRACAAFFPLNGTEHFRFVRYQITGRAEAAPAPGLALTQPEERCRLAIGVMCTPSKPAHRKAVRETWGEVGCSFNFLNAKILRLLISLV
jgi:hypothetical protein